MLSPQKKPSPFITSSRGKRTHVAVTSTEAIVEVTPQGMRAFLKNGSGIELGRGVRQESEWSEG